jgi:hypothetical protein
MLLGLGVWATGCGGGGDNGGGGGNSLVGTWQVTAFVQNGTSRPPEAQMTITIGADGTFSSTEIDNGQTRVENGTWSEANGQLTLSWPASGNEPARSEIDPYTLDGNTLTLTIPEVGDAGQPADVILTRQ